MRKDVLGGAGGAHRRGGAGTIRPTCRTVWDSRPFLSFEWQRELGRARAFYTPDSIPRREEFGQLRLREKPLGGGGAVSSGTVQQTFRLAARRTEFPTTRFAPAQEKKSSQELLPAGYKAP